MNDISCFYRLPAEDNMSKKGVFLLLIERLVTVSFYSVNQKTVKTLTLTLNYLQIGSQTTRKERTNGYSPKHLASPVENIQADVFRKSNQSVNGIVIHTIILYFLDIMS